MSNDPRTKPVAELLLADYATGYSADHLTWRDFEKVANEALRAADAAAVNPGATAAPITFDRASERAAVAAEIEAAILAEKLKPRPDPAVDRYVWGLHVAARLARSVGQESKE